MVKLVDWMKQVAEICVKTEGEEMISDYQEEIKKIREEVRALAVKFPVPGVK